MSSDNFAVPVGETRDDNNYLKINFLLGKNRLQKGCNCTLDRGLKYTNPFFGNVQDKIDWGSTKFNSSCFIRQNEAFKMHTVQLNSFGAFQDAIKIIKPPIYASEWVIANSHAIGCVYRLMIKLHKGNIISEYIRDYKFTKVEKVQIAIEIRNYEVFDTISYCHYLTASDNLSFKRLYSVKVGKSSLKIGKEVLNSYYQDEWTEDLITEEDDYDDMEEYDEEDNMDMADGS